MKKVKKNVPRNTFVAAMMGRYKNSKTSMRDRRKRRSKDKKNSWQKDWE